jgi:two-component system osmolarity sensor histidine kinase EnvZ
MATLKTKIRAAWAVLLSSVGSAFILGLGVIAAAALVLRNLSRPLRALAEAADKVGQGAHVASARAGPATSSWWPRPSTPCRTASPAC